MLGRPFKCTGIGIYVTAAGSAGSKIRIGLYDNTEATGLPRYKLIDSGEIAADTVGAKQITIDPIDLWDDVYWTCLLVNDTDTS